MNVSSQWIATGMVVAAIILFGVLYASSETTDRIVAPAGLHSHVTLRIISGGEEIPIPRDIGVGELYRDRPQYGNGGMAMTPIHTHDDVPIIHLEFAGDVTDNDLMLERFFEVWGKDFHEFGQDVRMTVNGIDNPDLHRYIMKDGDSITLEYN